MGQVETELKVNWSGPSWSIFRFDLAERLLFC